MVATLVDRQHLPPWLRAALVVGVLGGYTIFSTYAQEALDLLEEAHVGAAFAYSAGSVVAGMTAVLLGTLVGQHTLSLAVYGPLPDSFSLGLASNRGDRSARRDRVRRLGAREIGA